MSEHPLYYDVISTLVRVRPDYEVRALNPASINFWLSIGYTPERVVSEIIGVPVPEAALAE